MNDEKNAAHERVTDEELAALQQAIDALLDEEWIREVVQDGEVLPDGTGYAGEWLESNDIITRPTEDAPGGRRVCECASGQIAAFVVLARDILPRACAELQATRALVNVEAEVERLCRDPRYVNVANVYIRALATPLLERVAGLTSETEGMRKAAAGAWGTLIQVKDQLSVARRQLAEHEAEIVRLTKERDALKQFAAAEARGTQKLLDDGNNAAATAAYLDGKLSLLLWLAEALNKPEIVTAYLACPNTVAKLV